MEELAEVRGTRQEQRKASLLAGGTRTRKGMRTETHAYYFRAQRTLYNKSSETLRWSTSKCENEVNHDWR